MGKVVNVSNEVKNLDMEFHYGELKMVTGESFSVNVEGIEAEKIIIEESGDILKIYDQRQTRRIKAKNILFGKNKEEKGCVITFTIPEATNFDRVSVRTGAVDADIESIKTAILTLEMGVGDVDIEHLEVTNYGKVSTGTGDIEINSGCMNDMNMGFGVGDVDINVKMTGDSKISVGVGDLSLVLEGEQSDYCISASKAIGACHIHGFDVSGNNSYGVGANKITASSAVGEISISLK